MARSYNFLPLSIASLCYFSSHMLFLLRIFPPTTWRAINSLSRHDKCMRTYMYIRKKNVKPKETERHDDPEVHALSILQRTKYLLVSIFQEKSLLKSFVNMIRTFFHAIKFYWRARRNLRYFVILRYQYWASKHLMLMGKLAGKLFLMKARSNILKKAWNYVSSLILEQASHVVQT